MVFVQLDSINEIDCRGQEVNPDISGIGVRVSFYLQNVFLRKSFPLRGGLDAGGTITLI